MLKDLEVLSYRRDKVSIASCSVGKFVRVHCRNVPSVEVYIGVSGLC